jgi:hypothetical protein
MLQDYGDELIKVDTIILIVKMLTKHPLENAVLFATGDAYKFGALEFDDSAAARRFVEQLTDGVAYAALINGNFQVYQYPYRSRVTQEWVFVTPGRE